MLSHFSGSVPKKRGRPPTAQAKAVHCSSTIKAKEDGDDGHVRESGNGVCLCKIALGPFFFYRAPFAVCKSEFVMAHHTSFLGMDPYTDRLVCFISFPVRRHREGGFRTNASLLFANHNNVMRSGIQCT